MGKDSARAAAIGDVDEANSALGIALLHVRDGTQRCRLLAVQNELFDLGADLATPGEDFAPSEMALRIVQAQIDRLEREIDAMNEALEPLKSFILPGGSEQAARLHIARAVCRRAERDVLEAAQERPVNPLAVVYLNRLSDLLFILARAAAGGNEPLWKPGGER
jgi:cob(I)alamin adenosyltransferase